MNLRAALGTLVSGPSTFPRPAEEALAAMIEPHWPKIGSTNPIAPTPR